MMQKYQFFFNSSVLTFTKIYSQDKEDLGRKLRYFDPAALQSFSPSSLPSPETNEHWVFICGERLQQAVLQFKKLFRIINAGGGLVRAPDQSILFIFRNGVWDLPKGKQEEGEPIEQTALREVEEECGLRNLILLNEIQKTYHIYFLQNQAILKQTHWFSMQVPEKVTPSPQKEEGIQQALWLPESALDKVMKNTYPSIRELFPKYKSKE